MKPLGVLLTFIFKSCRVHLGIQHAITLTFASAVAVMFGLPRIVNWPIAAPPLVYRNSYNRPFPMYSSIAIDGKSLNSCIQALDDYKDMQLKDASKLFKMRLESFIERYNSSVKLMLVSKELSRRKLYKFHAGVRISDTKTGVLSVDIWKDYPEQYENIRRIISPETRIFTSRYLTKTLRPDQSYVSYLILYFGILRSLSGDVPINDRIVFKELIRFPERTIDDYLLVFWQIMPVIVFNIILMCNFASLRDFQRERALRLHLMLEGLGASRVLNTMSWIIATVLSLSVHMLLFLAVYEVCHRLFMYTDIPQMPHLKYRSHRVAVCFMVFLFMMRNTILAFLCVSQLGMNGRYLYNLYNIVQLLPFTLMTMKTTSSRETKFALIVVPLISDLMPFSIAVRTCVGIITEPSQLRQKYCYCNSYGSAVAILITWIIILLLILMFMEHKNGLEELTNSSAPQTEVAATSRAPSRNPQDPVISFEFFGFAHFQETATFSLRANKVYVILIFNDDLKYHYLDALLGVSCNYKGFIFIQGDRCSSETLRSSVRVYSKHQCVYDKLSTMENIVMMINVITYGAIIFDIQLFADMGLTEVLYKPLGSLTERQRQMCSMLTAFYLCTILPTILIALDDPLLGLTAWNQKKVAELILRYAEKQTILIFSKDTMAFENIAEEVILISNTGAVATFVTREKMKDSMSGRYTLTVVKSSLFKKVTLVRVFEQSQLVKKYTILSDDALCIKIGVQLQKGWTSIPALFSSLKAKFMFGKVGANSYIFHQTNFIEAFHYLSRGAAVSQTDILHGKKVKKTHSIGLPTKGLIHNFAIPRHLLLVIWAFLILLRRRLEPVIIYIALFPSISVLLFLRPAIDVPLPNDPVKTVDYDCSNRAKSVCMQYSSKLQATDLMFLNLLNNSYSPQKVKLVENESSIDQCDILINAKRVRSKLEFRFEAAAEKVGCVYSEQVRAINTWMQEYDLPVFHLTAHVGNVSRRNYKTSDYAQDKELSDLLFIGLGIGLVSATVVVTSQDMFSFGLKFITDRGVSHTAFFMSAHFYLSCTGFVFTIIIAIFAGSIRTILHLDKISYSSVHLFMLQLGTYSVSLDIVLLFVAIREHLHHWNLRQIEFMEFLTTPLILCAYFLVATHDFFPKGKRFLSAVAQAFIPGFPSCHMYHSLIAFGAFNKYCNTNFIQNHLCKTEPWRLRFCCDTVCPYGCPWSNDYMETYVGIGYTITLVIVKFSCGVLTLFFIDLKNLSKLMFHICSGLKDKSGDGATVLTVNNALVPEINQISSFSFQCMAGQCTAIISNNAEVATSIFRLIRRTNIQSRGEVIFCGEVNPFSTSIYRRKIGFSAQSVLADTTFLVNDLLYISAMIRGVPACTLKSHCSLIVEKFHLRKFLYREIKDISEVYRRVAQIAFAFIGFPKLVLLDEPLKNVDPYFSAIICNAVRFFTASGCAVAIGTQSLDHCEWFGVTQVCLFNQGVLVSTSSLKDLLSVFRAGYVFSVHLVLPEEKDKDFGDFCDPTLERRKVVQDFVLAKFNNAIPFSETSLRIDFYVNPGSLRDIIALYNQLVELMPDCFRSLSFGSTTDQTRLDIYAKMSLSNRGSLRRR